MLLADVLVLVEVGWLIGMLLLIIKTGVIVKIALVDWLEEIQDVISVTLLATLIVVIAVLLIIAVIIAVTQDY